MVSENASDKQKNRGKERLLLAAQKLASERSFDEITIEDIIKDARLSRPAFYYHFAGGKEELRMLLVERGLLQEEPAQDTRQEVLQAALRVFARSGISAATLDDIAGEAGVTRGALCWHFHSKDDLLAGIIKEFGPHSMLCPAIDEIDRELHAGVPLDDETIFRRLAGAFYDGFTAQGHYTRLAILLIYTHPEVAELLVDRIVKGRKSITEYIEKRQREGAFCEHIHAGFFVQVMAMTFAMRAIGKDLNELLPFGYFSRDEMVNQITSLLLYGIVRRDSPPHATDQKADLS